MIRSLLRVVQKVQQGVGGRWVQAFGERRLAALHLGPGRVQVGVGDAVDTGLEVDRPTAARVEEPQLAVVAHQQVEARIVAGSS
ncbi:hypothetical protein D3C81_1820780 [compost metagenome]